LREGECTKPASERSSTWIGKTLSRRGGGMDKRSLPLTNPSSTGGEEEGGKKFTKEETLSLAFEKKRDGKSAKVGESALVIFSKRRGPIGPKEARKNEPLSLANLRNSCERREEHDLLDKRHGPRCWLVLRRAGGKKKVPREELVSEHILSLVGKKGVAREKSSCPASERNFYGGRSALS